MSTASINDLLGLQATAQAEAVRRGDVSSLELVDSSIARIEHAEPSLNAISWQRFEQAREEAKRSMPDAPFAGVPILLKDHRCWAAGQENRTGTIGLRENPRSWSTDSHVYQSIRGMGFVVLGRTTSPEFATALITESVASGVTRNPLALDRTSGGSSGGAASAVASGMVSVAHATDGGGSIRVPASACGLVGLKPSRGRVSIGPDASESWAGATVEGVLARTVGDSAAVTRGMSRRYPGDPYVAPGEIPAEWSGSLLDAPQQRLRVGVLERMPGGEAFKSADVAQSLRLIADVLASAGHDVRGVTPAPLDEDYSTRFELMIAADVEILARKVEDTLGRPIPDSELAPRNLRTRKLATSTGAVDYVIARHWLGSWCYRFGGWWHDEQIDVLMLPTLGNVPASAGADPSDDEDLMRRSAEMQPLTSFANITGLPAISLPLGVTPEGLPVGIQFVGRLGDEATLLAIAGSFERHGPWHGAFQIGPVV